MQRNKSQREGLLARIAAAGGLRPQGSAALSGETGVPEADVYGTASFYPLLRDGAPTPGVCQGLSCWLAGADIDLTSNAPPSTGERGCGCLARCDAAPARWDPEHEGDEVALRCGLMPADADRIIDLAGPSVERLEALDRVLEQEPEAVLDLLEASGLQGRGGAGFPLHIKWRAVRGQSVTTRHLVLNADEGEPGTFKDREVMLRRPDRVIEGLAIAAHVIGASTIWCFVRRELGGARAALEQELERRAPQLREALGPDVEWRFVDGQGAYVCGEETALLEAIEGRRGMPRLKPPLPVEAGLFGEPTLVQNVETLACVPEIVNRGAAHFVAQGGDEPGSKLYCVSGHVVRPGVYELPLGTTLRGLLDVAGGVVGRLKAFSPGGASSGFLPAEAIDLPLDFGHLSRAGSMLGSAGVVVLNDTVNMREAALVQARFFEEESCGQCTPCRIGTRVLREALERVGAGASAAALDLEEILFVMDESSICGLGQAAPLPLISGMAYFPADFGLARGAKRFEAAGPVAQPKAEEGTDG
jgi:NADH:ubiquinone oxidoreductase subunit F (NADH-binding)